MLFNSIEFAFFLPVVFMLYWLVVNRNLRTQNLLVLAASYFFYGWWDWRFLGLIIFSTVVDFTVGNQLAVTDEPGKRKTWLWVSIVTNLGLLGFFKYYNFFAENLMTAFTFFGSQPDPFTLKILLPVGISFYTFQTLSYTIDVYRRKLTPTRDFIAFSAFVSFFPQLVAGPIERATHLLPQFFRERKFSYPLAVDGLRQIIWGLFKKVVIADNCAKTVNLVFESPDQFGGSTLALGAILFALQIYGDFSGYSDIAIGTSRLFGFDLKQNFAFPYFSRDVAEFWRRWHISLSTWFRDYLYIPLGGSRLGKIFSLRNTFIVFAVSGFWHGANWTFLIWGILNALFYLPLLLSGNNRANLGIVAENRALPSFRELLQMLSTFSLITVAWVFFRAESIKAALAYLKGIFSRSLFSLPTEAPSLSVITMILIFLVVEWWGRRELHPLAALRGRFNQPVRFGLYYFIMVALLFLGQEEQSFIYFQF